jgi:hypothetical protein
VVATRVTPSARAGIRRLLARQEDEPGRARPRRHGRAHGGGQRGADGLLTHRALGGHRLEDEVAAGPHAPGHVGERAARRTDGGGEERRLVERERIEVLAEEVPGPRSHAEHGGIPRLAEINRIEVRLEDLALGVAPLEPESDPDLPRLPPPGALAIEEEASRELLGDRARPADDPGLPGIAQEGATHRQQVHSDVAHEPAVFRRDHRRHHHGRNAVQRQPELGAARRAPRIVVNARDDGQVLARGGELDVRALARTGGGQGIGEPRPPHRNRGQSRTHPESKQGAGREPRSAHRSTSTQL